MLNRLVEKSRGMGIGELTATTDSGNKAAIGLLEKCGFKKQKSGWMVRISEDADAGLESGQTVIQYWRSI